MSTELKNIKKLLSLLDEYPDIGEITMTQDESGASSVTIKRNQPVSITASQPALTAPMVAPTPMPAPVPTQASTQPHDVDAADTNDTQPEGDTIASPMVGTCYLAPSPEAGNFVAVGDTIKEGQTLCLIEAMKMFNKIKAEKSGTVKACLVQNGQPIEFDQPLFIIET